MSCQSTHPRPGVWYLFASVYCKHARLSPHGALFVFTSRYKSKVAAKQATKSWKKCEVNAHKGGSRGSTSLLREPWVWVRSICFPIKELKNWRRWQKTLRLWINHKDTAIFCWKQKLLLAAFSPQSIKYTNRETSEMDICWTQKILEFGVAPVSIWDNHQVVMNTE